MSKDNPLRVITRKVRISYANVHEPRAQEEGEKPKYSAAILISKDDEKTLGLIERAIEAAKKAGKEKWGGKIPRNLKLPLRDGDEERPEDEAYENVMFLNASSIRRPEIVERVNGELEELEDPDDFYSGCYCRVSLNFYPFSVSGNKGVAVGLGNIQKLEDGERLSGGSSAEDDFGDLEEDDDDSLI